MRFLNDISLGLTLILILASGLFVMAYRLLRFASRRALTLYALLPAAAILLHLFVVRDSILLARILPFSNLIVLGNWVPLFVAALAAIAWRGIPGGPGRKSLTVVPLAAGSLFLIYAPLLGRPPQCGDWWSNGVCMQTSDASCSAACAATLLRCRVIRATEREMARLCLTRKEGTSKHGLYRGLKLKTAKTPWTVSVFKGDVPHLRRQAPTAVLLFVGLKRGAKVDRRYEEQWGWKPGVLHTVVLFRFVGNDRIEIGDPAIGREKWPVTALNVLWDGCGLELVRRR